MKPPEHCGQPMHLILERVPLNDVTYQGPATSYSCESSHCNYVVIVNSDTGEVLPDHCG